MVLGDILMLSEGVRGVDNIYSLKDGMHDSRCNSFRVSIIWSDMMTLPQES